MPRKPLTYVSALFALHCHPQVAVTVDTTLHFQTMLGWEAMGWMGQWGSPWAQTHYPEFQPALVNGAANIGITRARIEVYSGCENPVDHFQQFLDGMFDEDGFIQVAYDIVNDNGNSAAIDTTRFHFTQLDWDMDHVLVPLKTAVEAQGRAFSTNLCYVDFGASAFEHYNDPAEYAEFLLAVFQHLQRKYGFVPDQVEAVLEPDNTVWPTATLMAGAIHAAGDLLAAHGYHPGFIAPSCMDTFNAYAWANTIMNDPLAAQYVKEVGYHKYSGAIDANIALVNGVAQSHGVRTSMLEFWDHSNDQHALYRDIVTGGVSVWQNGIIGDDYVDQFSPALFRVQHNDPQPATVLENDLTRFFRQYMLHIPVGARRTGVNVTTPHEATAFIGTRGELIIVVNAATSATFQVTVPAGGTYHRWRSTTALNHVAMSDATVPAGGVISITMPAAGVFTIAQEPPPAVLLDLRAALQGPMRVDGSMRTDLAAAAFIPATEPFTAAGFPSAASLDRPCAPAVLGGSGANAPVDWLRVELRDKNNPASILSTRSGMLLVDGRVVDMGGGPLRITGASDLYYIAVKHRDHLGIMTAGPVALSTGAITTIDLTSASTACFGTNARTTVAGKQALWCGDVSHNGQIKYTGAGNDRDPILVAVGGTTPNNVITGYRFEDVNMDGAVKYTGTDNDRDPILMSIGGTAANSVKNAQLP